jgi:hypothetical protein
LTSKTVEVGSLNKGLYFIRILDNNRLLVKKFFKN